MLCLCCPCCVARPWKDLPPHTHTHTLLNSSNSEILSLSPYGTSAYLLGRLQSVLNSAARLILTIGKYDPISAAIRRDLHWLPIPFRIRYKLNSITSNCWMAAHRSTWSSSATPWMTVQPGATFGRRPELSSWFLGIGKNDPVEEVSPSPHHNCGTYFLLHNEHQLQEET